MERDFNLHLEHKKHKAIILSQYTHNAISIAYHQAKQKAYTLTRRRWPFLESASECLDLIMRVFVYQSTFEVFFHQTQSVVHYKLGCRMYV